MPMVGSEKFPYSKNGFADAKKAAKQSGAKMSLASKTKRKC